MRYTFSAAASAFVLPMIQKIGVGWTNTFSAGMVWVAFGLILLTIRYGEEMRRFGKRWDGSREDEESVEKGGDVEKARVPMPLQSAAAGNTEQDSERTVVDDAVNANPKV